MASAYGGVLSYAAAPYSYNETPRDRHHASADGQSVRRPCRSAATTNPAAAAQSARATQCRIRSAGAGA